MPVPADIPERRVDPRKANHGELVRFLRENGITNLDDLVEFALQQAQAAGAEEQLWALIVRDKYVVAGTE